jgi:hypothetical protein
METVFEYYGIVHRHLNDEEFIMKWKLLEIIRKEEAKER